MPEITEPLSTLALMTNGQRLVVPATSQPGQDILLARNAITDWCSKNLVHGWRVMFCEVSGAIVIYADDAGDAAQVRKIFDPAPEPPI